MSKFEVKKFNIRESKKTDLNYILKMMRKNKCDVNELINFLFRIDISSLDQNSFDKIYENLINRPTSSSDLFRFVKNLVFLINTRIDINRENGCIDFNNLIDDLYNFLAKFGEYEKNERQTRNRKSILKYSEMDFSKEAFNNKDYIGCYVSLIMKSSNLLSDDQLYSLIEKLECDEDYLLILKNCRLIPTLAKSIITSFLDKVGPLNNIEELLYLTTNKTPNYNHIKDIIIDYLLYMKYPYPISRLSVNSLKKEQFKSILETLRVFDEDLSKFILNNGEKLDYEHMIYIYEYFSSCCDMQSIYEVYRTSKVCDDSLVSTDTIDSLILSIETDDLDIEYLYRYMILSNNRNEQLINKIIQSGNIKYIILTAININKGIFDKLFNNNQELLLYVQECDLFTDVEKQEIDSMLRNDEQSANNIIENTNIRIHKLINESANGNKKNNN